MAATLATIGKTPRLQDAVSVLEKLVANGDLSKLKPEDRLKYYYGVCESLGLNHLTRPFEYIKLEGKLTLYARKDCTDQLRKLHDVSIVNLQQMEVANNYMVTATATTPTGRQDSDIGAVPLIYPQYVWKWDEEGTQRIRESHADAGKRLSEPDFCNAVMKATTKAKRRVTLSICSLGFVMDETEVDDLPTAQTATEDTVDRLITTTKTIRVANPADRQISAYPVDAIQIVPALRSKIEEIVARAHEKGKWEAANQYIDRTLLPTVKDMALRETARQYAIWLLQTGQIEAALGSQPREVNYENC